MDNIFKQLEVFSVKQDKRLKKVCAPLFQHFNLDYYFLQLKNREGSFGFISTHIDLANYYFGNELHFHNPFITQQNEKEGVYFIDFIRKDDYQSDLHFIECKFKAKHVLSIIKNSNGISYEHGFATQRLNDFNPSLLINNLPLLNRFIEYFNLEVSDIIKSILENLICLQNILPDKSSLLLPSINLTEASQKQFLAQTEIKFEKDVLFKNFKLSEREIDILQYYYKGKTAREVADILHLSQRTIENYLGNIKSKLYCENVRGQT